MLKIIFLAMVPGSVLVLLNYYFFLKFIPLEKKKKTKPMVLAVYVNGWILLELFFMLAIRWYLTSRVDMDMPKNGDNYEVFLLTMMLFCGISIFVLTLIYASKRQKVFNGVPKRKLRNKSV